MPRRAKGPYLWLRPGRHDGRGQHDAVWIIKDRGVQTGTGCLARDLAGAERALQTYLAQKHGGAAKRLRDPDQIPIADVLNLYLEQKVESLARPDDARAHIARLASYFGEATMLGDINGELCRAFVKARGTATGAAGDLSLLRAAINLHRREGYHDRVISVWLPEKNEPRDRWLTRPEAAKLIRSAWRYREIQKGKPTDRASRKHVARFILIGLYTGTRAGAICAASFKPKAGHGYIDVDRGVFYRRAPGERQTKKRKPPIPLPPGLLAHLRRWKRKGQQHPVEWNGDAVHDCDRAFRSVARDCGLDDVTPHTLRHTSATWQMQAGTDLWQAAGFIGMSPQTLHQTYGHHHPDHLDGARLAFRRMVRTAPARNREQSDPATAPPPKRRNKTRKERRGTARKWP